MLAFIDCFVEQPVHHSFNQFVIQSGMPATYHMVSKFGFESLYKVADSTSGYIILGSASNLEQNLPWHKPLAEFIDKNLKKGIPCLGICFGHQLMANFYDCEVGFLTPEKTYFKEAREITFTDRFAGYAPGDKIKLAYAHEQAVLKLSNAFDIVATSDRSEFECLKHKSLPLFCTQSHPEASLTFIQENLGEIDSGEIIQAGHTFLQSFVDEYKINHLD